MNSQDFVEASFRRQSARLVSLLTRAFGPGHLSAIEDAVQQAFVRAVEVWPAKGVPENAPAWLMLVARRNLLDDLRRQGHYLTEDNLENISEEIPEPDMLADEELSMLFLCCHPSLPAESQLALMLRELCGLSTAEVAKSLLISEDAAAQRLVRAKQQLKGLDDPFEVSERDLDARLENVLRAIYLVFNEGYASHAGAALTRSDVCDEAILLTNRLSKTKVGDKPETHALLALMLLHSSRLPARVSEDGSLCLLEDQDRSKWDQARIAAGIRSLHRAREAGGATSYHYEAAIAAVHACAKRFEDTDWGVVLSLYSDLAQLRPTPIVLLNRAIAMAFAGHPQEAMEQLAAVENSKSLKNYYLLPATKARLLEREGSVGEAIAEYKRALALTKNESERTFLHKRITLIN